MVDRSLIPEENKRPMRNLVILLLALAACSAPEPRFKPSPGNWKDVKRWDEWVKAREFGMIRVLVDEPMLQKNGILIVRMWIENRTNNLIVFNTKDITCVEPDGHVCKNEAPEEQHDLSGVGDELALGEFTVQHPLRCEKEGFTVRFQVTPYEPLAGNPYHVEISFVKHD
jgi:hypothetical protein